MADGPGPGSPVLPAWQVIVLTALAYAGAGVLALLLAGPPGYAAPLYPPAGIALAAALVAGPAALPGVFIGAAGVNAALGVLRGAEGLSVTLLLPAAIGAGAMLQAQLGVWLLRRHVGPQPGLSEPGDIARAGLWAGLVASLCSPTVATAALALAGVLGPGQWLPTWGTWWLGDTLGVLIVAPVVLTLIGQPAADWRPRRRTLALPLLAALGVLALGVHQVRQLDGARQRDLFEHDAEQLVVLVKQRLEEATHALQALDSAARVAGRPLEAPELRAASAWWRDHVAALHVAAQAVRVPEGGVDAFIAQVRREGAADFDVTDRDGGADRRRRGELLVLTHLEPQEHGRGAAGLNAWSVEGSRAALEGARDSGEPRVSPGFVFTPSGREEPGVTLVQALYAPAAEQPSTLAERRERWSGALLLTLRTELALGTLDDTAAARLSWCLLDADVTAPVRRLASAGPAEPCAERAPRRGELRAEQRVEWGGRTWLLRMSAPVRAATLTQGEAGLLSLTGLLAAAMLGALLLVVTGHTRRIERAVAAGTEQLRNEVGERRHAEAEQRETRERLQGILDNAPLGVLFLDPQGLVIECNARFSEMTGLPAEALSGVSVLERVHPDDREPLLAMRRDLMRGAATRAMTRVQLRVQGAPPPGYTPVRVIASALRDDGGRVLRVVAVIEDVADQLRLQASEQARLRAEAANRAKNEFLSRMSHELRTPLNAMIGFAQLLGLDREPALAAHQQDWVRQIQRAGWHLLELINETLDLSRIESGSVSLAPQPLDLHALAEAACALVASAAGQRGIRIDLTAAAGTPAALGDPTRVRQVLTNLLTNAVKYNRPDGTVHVHVDRSPEGAVRVAVRDTGLGMDTSQMARLFQPYDRLGREDSGIEGTGIGLVISQRLLELMGGSLAVESRLGLGSTFTFTLPATQERVAAEPEAAETGPAPYATRRVHYVEDNPTNIEVMRGILGQRPQVRLAVSMLGLDGLAAIRHDPPDLILLDMQLPDISGPELLRHLKNDDTLAKIPVIVVSADATPDHVRAALTLGARHYLTKPLDVSSFLEHIDEALEGLDTRWQL